MTSGRERTLAAARVPPALVWGALGMLVLLLWIAGYPLLVTLLEALGLGEGWTLAHLAAFAGRPDEWLALWRSVWISLASTALAAALGVPLGFLFARGDFPGRRVLGALVALPVALPPLVGVIAFLFLWGETGFAARAVSALLGRDALGPLRTAPWRLAGAPAILAVHAYSFYVYFYLFTRAGLMRLDTALEEAAAGLGVAGWRRLLRVTLPLLRPALGGAALLAFMTSLASFSAPYIFGGGFRVMTTQIAASKLNGDWAMARVEALALAVVAIGALALLRRLERRLEVVGGAVRGVAPARRGGPTARRGARRWLIAAAAWALAALLLAPHATLLLISLVPAATWTIEALPPVLSLANWRELGEAERWRPIVNSLWMASVATAGALLLGVAAASMARRLEHRAARSAGVAGGGRGRRGRRLAAALEALLGLPWAIPATVFAVALATTMSVSAPLAGRFLLIGTPWILVLGYLGRNLPLTGRAALAGLRQLDPALEEAAAALGASRLRTLWRVTLPLLRPALAAGASLAWIAALGDFVLSIVLYGYDSRPIAVEIYSHLRLQETGLAAVYGTLLMAASMAIFLLWGQSEEKW